MNDIRDIIDACETGINFCDQELDNNAVTAVLNYLASNECSRKFGDPVIFEGETYYLIESAYLDNYRGTANYQASAIDNSGNLYTVHWDIVCGDDNGDESNCCDWDCPSDVIKY